MDNDKAIIIPNSQKFQGFYNQIDNHLRKLTDKLDYQDSFTWIVKKLSGRNSLVRRYKDDLIQFGLLRNAIVHQYKEGKTIAEPHDKTVESIQRIWEAINNPPRLSSSPFKHEVFCVNIRDSIGVALKAMYENSFSQVPVIQNERIANILSNNTITFWLAANLELELVDLSDTSVEQVLQYGEEGPRYDIVHINTTLVEVLDLFQDFTKNGKYLDAILITQNGASHEKLLGIVTTEDVAQIIEILQL